MKRRIALHVVFWLGFWLWHAFLHSRYDNHFAKYMATEAIALPPKMLATYLSFWAFDRFSSAREAHRSWMAIGVAALANVLGGLGIRLLKMFFIVPIFFQTAGFQFWGYMFLYDIFDCMIVSSMALAARLYFRQQELRRKEENLHREKLDAELRALKSQIHPHFLFNTINNLYALARKKSPQTAPVALQLANLLRYVLYESAKKTVPLQQEIKNLRDFVELEKLRFDTERLRVDMDVVVDDPERPVTPLLLLPLVENAFKHGVSETREDAWVSIRIELLRQTLHIDIRNSLAPKNARDDRKGIGLENVRRQLELLYPNRHQLHTESSTDTFTLRLHIHFDT
jgi:hypothetical protein